KHKACNMGVLVRDLGLRVEHEQHHVARLDGLQGLDHGELFYRFEYLSTTTQTRRVDKCIGDPAAFKFDFNGIARRTRHIEGNDAFLAQQGIDERGLPYVGASDNGKLDAMVDRRLAVLAGFVGLLGVKDDIAVVVEGRIGLVKVKNRDRKSTRLNSSHVKISYAVFCLKEQK